jgi:Rad3-related DNA helicase
MQLVTPTPAEFGLPAHFTSWRAQQFDIVDRIATCPSRFMMVCAPTGAGKSLMYMAAAMLSGKRTVVLTSTKGLQDQLARDFAEISVDLRGMQNYICGMAEAFDFPSSTKVADAPCLAGARCPKQAGGCGYFDDYRRAMKADIVVTNYQCWMYDSMKREGLGRARPVEMLILDEAHAAVDQLSAYLSTELARKECLSLGVTWPVSGYCQGEWADWARYWAKQLCERIGKLEKSVREGGGGAGRSVLHEIRELKRLARKLDAVSEMEDDWVIEELGKQAGDMRAVRFDPLWPRKYSERLFREVKKVVFVSATVRPKTAELLGIGADQLDFTEYASAFPVRNRPAIHVPTVHMNYRNEADDAIMLWWLRKIDLLVGARGDRKGVIHTVSYKRARFLVDNSAHAGRMLVHGSDNRMETIERFRRADPGTGMVLVSPSVDTGYDFKYAEAEYQIISKLPFPDTRGAIMKARCAADRDYSSYLTAQILQQMTGRVCRAEDDRGETLIVDDNVGRFVSKYRRFLNEWWLEGYRVQKGRLPEPLEKL